MAPAAGRVTVRTVFVAALPTVTVTKRIEIVGLVYARRIRNLNHALTESFCGIGSFEGSAAGKTEAS